MKKSCVLFLLSAVLFPSAMFPSVFAAQLATAAVSDAFVATGPTGNLRNNNYGGGGALGVAASGLPLGEFQTVLKFDLSTARNSLDAQYGAGAWTIQSVSLQLSSSPHNNAIYNDIGTGQFNVSLMQNNAWVEGSGNASNPGATGITYNSLQTDFRNDAVDQSLGTFGFNGGTSGANQYSLQFSPGLTADILAGDLASLRLFAADNNVSYLFSSRAASPASSQPQLVIDAIPEPGVLALFGLGLGILCFRWSINRDEISGIRRGIGISFITSRGRMITERTVKRDSCATLISSE